jgi:NADPH-dependent curcumin reductase CurA
MTAGLINRTIRLKSRPDGMCEPDTWELTEEPVREPGDGEVLVRVRYISLDPAMRGWIADRESYVPPVPIGDVMRALAVGEVTESKHPELEPGDYVSGLLGVQEYVVVHGGTVQKLPPDAGERLPLFLGALGMPGMTAYFGLIDIGRPEPGQTVVVSGAAGAVGHLVGQIAKLKGARAIGIAGGPEKCRYVTEEAGFDAAIDYKREDVGVALREHCPDGIDVYFDNVGGEILDAALAQLARYARVVICGAISQYNAREQISGPANYLALLVKHASMTGYVVTDYLPRYQEGLGAMSGWLQSGGLKTREDIVNGLESFPDALQMLFSGANHGKLVLQVSD